MYSELNSLHKYSHVFKTRVHSTTSSSTSRDDSITFENKEGFMPSSSLWKSRSNGLRIATNRFNPVHRNRQKEGKEIVAHAATTVMGFSPEVTVL